MGLEVLRSVLAGVMIFLHSLPTWDYVHRNLRWNELTMTARMNHRIANGPHVRNRLRIAESALGAEHPDTTVVGVHCPEAVHHVPPIDHLGGAAIPHADEADGDTGLGIAGLADNLDRLR